MREMIEHRVLKALVETGAVREAQLIGTAGGYAGVVKVGMTERRLATQRGHVRLFKRLDVAAAYLRDAGIVRFGVDTAQYSRQAVA